MITDAVHSCKKLTGQLSLTYWFSISRTNHKSKEKVNNSVCRKIYDKAQTPYQRLIDSNQISDDQKQELKELYLSLNPVELKTKIDLKLNKIKNLKPIFINNLQTSMVRNYMTQPVGSKVRFLND